MEVPRSPCGVPCRLPHRAVTSVERPAVSPLLLPARTWPPPDRGLLAATGVAVVVMAEAASRASFFFFAIGAVAGMIVAFTWLFRIVPTLVHRRMRLSRGDWLRWLSVPVLLLGAYATFQTTILFDLRLAASRGAMDEAAMALMADEDLEYGWIGWFPVASIDRDVRGVRFLIADSGFFELIGFAYTTDGKPPVIGEHSYERLDGNWWHWQEGW